QGARGVHGAWRRRRSRARRGAYEAHRPPDGLRRRRDDRRARALPARHRDDPSGRTRGAHGAPAADDRRLRLPLRRRRHAARRHDEDHADPRRGGGQDRGRRGGTLRQADHAELRLGVTELGLLARFVHLSASILIVGSAALVLLAGRSDRPTALAWESRVVALTRALIWLALGAGLAVLAHQTAILESSVVAALAADVGHLLAAGVWAGALPALVLLLRAASREAGADARPYAVLAARRFSRAALILMTALLATGILITAVQVGSVGALLGTRY